MSIATRAVNAQYFTGKCDVTVPGWLRHLTRRRGRPAVEAGSAGARDVSRDASCAVRRGCGAGARLISSLARCDPKDTKPNRLLKISIAA